MEWFTLLEEEYKFTSDVSLTTEQVIKKSCYDSFNPLINSQNFPIRKRDSKIRTIKFIKFNGNFFLQRYLTDEGVLHAMTQLGLSRPDYEDALFFGMHYLEVYRGRKIIFLHERLKFQHEPLKYVPGSLVLALDGIDYRRKIELMLTGIWNCYFRVFAAVDET